MAPSASGEMLPKKMTSNLKREENGESHGRNFSKKGRKQKITASMKSN